MGAVQKLATVVIVGLTALAVLLVLSLADEPNRRKAEAEEQEHVAIERGIDTYVTYCLACHGPAGEGSEGGEGWIGKPIGGNTSATLLNQSTDPVIREERENFIRLRIHGGQPIGCTQQGTTCIMPSWGEDYGGELNDEQIEELVLMIQNVDWDLVYNDAIEANDGAYPEPPAPAAAEESAAEGTQTGEEGNGGAAAQTVELSAPGIAWSTNEISIAQGGTIKLINDGSGGPHNFAIEGYNDDAPVDMPPGSETDWTVPADLAPGTYTFYCAIPGHRALMEGTITVTAPEAGGASGEEAASPAADEATPEAEAATPAAVDATPDAGAATPVAGEATPAAGAATAISLETVDLAFSETELTIPANTDVTLTLTNQGKAVHDFKIDDPEVYSGPVEVRSDCGSQLESPAGYLRILLLAARPSRRRHGWHTHGSVASLARAGAEGGIQ